MEMQCMWQLAAAGVSVPRPLAGCWQGGSHWLMTEGVEPSVAGDEWHAQQVKAGDWPAIRQATIALADLVARMHEAGVTHPDLHGGNVLVRDGSPSDLVLIDLHRMGRHRHLSLRQRAANLAILLQDRLELTRPTDRLRFLRRYVEVTNGPRSLALWLGYIEPVAEKLRQRNLRRRDHRILGRNSYFSPIQSAGYFGRVMLRTKCQLPQSACFGQRLSVSNWQQALDGLELLGQNVAQPTSSQPVQTIRRILRVGPAELDVLVTRESSFAARGRGAAAAMRAFVLGHRLLNRRILTRRPLAVIEHEGGTILISEFLPATLLKEYLNGCGELHPDASRQTTSRRLLWQLGRWIARMQQEGFVLVGLTGDNVLVYEDARPQLVLDRLAKLSGSARRWPGGSYRISRPGLQRRFDVLVELAAWLQDNGSVNRAAYLRLLLGWLPPGTDHKPYWRLLQERLAQTRPRSTGSPGPQTASEKVS
jgi:tRNA A-37 threonylcarbamoyl transferase component Bud32